jgi:hypothetical protein
LHNHSVYAFLGSSGKRHSLFSFRYYKSVFNYFGYIDCCLLLAIFLLFYSTGTAKGRIMEWPLKPNVGDVIRGEARTPFGQPLFENMTREQFVALGYIEQPCSLSGWGARNVSTRRNIEGEKNVG